jgi:hypothetical protein
VDVEREPFLPPYRHQDGVYWSASDDLGAAGRGAYVEFDLPPDLPVRELPDNWFAGGRRGATILLPEDAMSLDLTGLRPRFVKWWRWYYLFLPWKQR